MKKTSRNVTYQFAYQLLALLVPFITGPIISRSLGPTLIGEYNYALSIVNYFCLFSTLGLATLGTREIGKCKDIYQQRTKVFWDLYYIKLLLSLFLFFIYSALFLMNKSTSVDRILYLILFLYFIGQVLDISWLFFGVEDFKTTVLKNSAIKLVSLILIVSLIRNQSDYYLYALIIALSELLSNSILWFNSKKYIGYSTFSFRDSLVYLKPALILFIPAIAASVYIYMDKIILGMMCESNQVGFYSSMEKIINIPFSFVTAITTVFYSKSISLLSSNEVSKSINLFNKSLVILCMILTPCCFGILIIAEYLVPVYFGDGFETVIILLKIGTLYLVFRSIRAVVKSIIMLPRSMDNIFVIAIVSGGIINISLNIIMVPLWGAVGAVFSTVVSDIISTCICLIASKKYIEHRIIVRDIMIIIFIGLIMYVSLFLFNNSTNCINPLLLILLDILLGGIVYILSLLLFLYLKTNGKIRSYFNI